MDFAEERISSKGTFVFVLEMKSLESSISLFPLPIPLRVLLKRSNALWNTVVYK
jgi:hypothetical protein